MSYLKGLVESSPKLALIDTSLNMGMETVGYRGFAVVLIGICSPADFVILYQIIKMTSHTETDPIRCHSK
jgi:hypothetical protein